MLSYLRPVALHHAALFIRIVKDQSVISIPASLLSTHSRCHDQTGHCFQLFTVQPKDLDFCRIPLFVTLVPILRCTRSCVKCLALSHTDQDVVVQPVLHAALRIIRTKFLKSFGLSTLLNRFVQHGMYCFILPGLCQVLFAVSLNLLTLALLAPPCFVPWDTCFGFRSLLRQRFPLCLCSFVLSSAFLCPLCCVSFLCAVLSCVPDCILTVCSTLVCVCVSFLRSVCSVCLVLCVLSLCVLCVFVSVSIPSVFLSPCLCMAYRYRLAGLTTRRFLCSVWRTKTKY